MRFLPVARHSRRLSGAKLEAALWVVNIDDFPRSSRNPHFIGFFSPGLPLSATRLLSAPSPCGPCAPDRPRGYSGDLVETGVAADGGDLVGRASASASLRQAASRSPWADKPLRPMRWHCLANHFEKPRAVKASPRSLSRRTTCWLGAAALIASARAAAMGIAIPSKENCQAIHSK